MASISLHKNKNKNKTKQKNKKTNKKQTNSCNKKSRIGREGQKRKENNSTNTRFFHASKIID